MIIINVDFKNNDDEKLVIFHDYVTLDDSKNQEYPNSIYYNLVKNRHDVTEDECPWGDSIELDPGLSDDANFCFEVPKENLTFVLHIYESDIDSCKNSPPEDCQEKTIKISVRDPDLTSLSSPD